MLPLLHSTTVRGPLLPLERSWDKAVSIYISRLAKLLIVWLAIIAVTWAAIGTRRVYEQAKISRIHASQEKASQFVKEHPWRTLPNAQRGSAPRLHDGNSLFVTVAWVIACAVSLLAFTYMLGRLHEKRKVTAARIREQRRVARKIEEYRAGYSEDAAPEAGSGVGARRESPR